MHVHGDQCGCSDNEHTDKESSDGEDGSHEDLLPTEVDYQGPKEELHEPDSRKVRRQKGIKKREKAKKKRGRK